MSPKRRHLLAWLALCIAYAQLASAAARSPDPAPRAAFAPVVLRPLPRQAVRQCLSVQRVAGFPVLCPARLPSAVIAQPSGRLPLLTAHRGSDLLEPTRVAGLSFTYGAPWEPDSGPGWQRHAWRDRPCCFLHFEIFRRPDQARFIPAGARPATLAGIHGLLAPASGYGQGRGPSALYAGNHTRFLFRRAGIPYVASLHYFGTAETLDLLTRLLAQLQPATALPVR